MVFIDKSTQHSQDSKKRLDDWANGFHFNGKSLEDLYSEEGQTGKNLWNIFGMLHSDQATVKAQLRIDLKIEQEFICCYCGQELDKTRIEHFLSKARDFKNRIFKYDNLILSCDGDPDEQSYTNLQYKSGKLETLQELAIRKGVSIEIIETYNQGIVEKHENAEIKQNKKIYLSRDHCDPYKGYIEDIENREISIVNPTIFNSCWKYFKFDYDGGISFNDKINDATIKTLVEDSIRVLNLDAEILRKKRKNALRSFIDELEIMLEHEQDFDIDTHFSVQFNTKKPFCFVIYHFINSF
jgi:uncharacterized protein (TIGR02646 family)